MIIELAEGYSIQYDVTGVLVGVLTPGDHGISLTSFYHGDDLLLCSINDDGIGIHYSTTGGGAGMTKEWFVEKLMEHPPLFEWFLWNPEIFESKT